MVLKEVRGMTTVTVSKQLTNTPDEVWCVVGGWNTLPVWHPEVTTSRLEADGLLRRVRLADGMEIVEQLEHYDRAERRYTYTIIESPLPLSSYRSTILVMPEDDGALTTWSTEFEAKGAPADEIAETLRTFYSVGLDNAQFLLGTR